MDNSHTPGSIHSRDRARQLRDFQGLRFLNNITPTDVDALLEFGDKAYVVVEVKYKRHDLDRGQRLAFERMVDRLERGGAPAILIQAVHEIENVDQDVNVAECRVVQFRWEGKWYQSEDVTVKEVIDGWLMMKGLGRYIRPIV